MGRRATPIVKNKIRRNFLRGGTYILLDEGVGAEMVWYRHGLSAKQQVVPLFFPPTTTARGLYSHLSALSLFLWRFVF